MPGPLFRPRPRPQATRTLFCLSFCGGGTAPFRAWADALPEDTELVLYCYPGREGRYDVPFARSWEELLGGALPALAGVAARPYVLLGHSMGAWVAFDLARRAERAGVALPQTLVVSAAHAPDRPRAEPAAPPHPGNTDEELLDWMFTIGQIAEVVRDEPELLRMAVEVLRVDLEVLDTYQFRPGDQVGPPIQLLRGEDDDIDAEDLDRWRRLTAGSFESTRLPGGHFYTPEVWSRLPERITALRPLQPSATPDRSARPSSAAVVPADLVDQAGAQGGAGHDGVQ
ncbi:alpha/beta fold hydrolase, partial [Micromonospora sp. NPDC005220]|uniref:thioesterase II family protein n=1 Tax=Micromonospora sp. NPDC005220 TaxID=3155589 RepID=UPI0033BBB369